MIKGRLIVEMCRENQCTSASTDFLLSLAAQPCHDRDAQTRRSTPYLIYHHVIVSRRLSIYPTDRRRRIVIVVVVYCLSKYAMTNLFVSMLNDPTRL